jgi:hypothetical protein
VSVDLHIGELVLDGLGAGDAELLRAALAGELETLIAGAGLPRAGSVEAIDAGAVRVPSRGGAEALGRTLAQSIHGSVWRC